MADVQESLMTYLWGVLTNSASLKTAMGGTVRCYPVGAHSDATFPYLVHRLDIRQHPGTHVVQNAAYYLDIWSDSPNITEITAIRALIVGLIDELVFNTTDVKQVHIESQANGFIPETEQDIWHYATLWDLIFRRDTEAAAIIAR